MRPGCGWNLAQFLLESPLAGSDLDLEPQEALKRLFRVADQDTNQGRRVADFLLALHRMEKEGGWFAYDPVDF